MCYRYSYVVYRINASCLLPARCHMVFWFAEESLWRLGSIERRAWPWQHALPLMTAISIRL